jgi:hypothetical protein
MPPRRLAVFADSFFESLQESRLQFAKIGKPRFAILFVIHDDAILASSSSPA